MQVVYILHTFLINEDENYPYWKLYIRLNISSPPCYISEVYREQSVMGGWVYFCIFFSLKNKILNLFSV